MIKIKFDLINVQQKKIYLIYKNSDLIIYKIRNI